VRIVSQRGLYFEELELATVYEHAPGRTIGESDNTLFTTLSMNPSSLHLDAFASQSSEFGQRIVNSFLTLATIVGLAVAHLTQGTSIANLGFESVQFPAPLFIGDTLYASTIVADKRLSRSRPGVGVVVFEHTGLNQAGTIVATARRTSLVLCRPGPEASEADAHADQDTT
jgi:acyl dehydratase